MPGTVWIVIVGVLTFDALIVWLIVRGSAKGTFGPLARAFPPKPHGLNPDRRRYQSFSFGLLNLGWSFKVAVDDEHVHLEPETWIRWSRIPSVSIPREKLTAQGSGWLDRTIRVETGGAVPVTVRGPRWLWEAVRNDSAAIGSAPG